MKKRLAYFEKFLDAAALPVFARCDDIELVRMSYDDPREKNLELMKTVHGYQLNATTEIRPGWRPHADLLEHCPNLLAVASAGAGYDTVDVNECTRRGVLVCNQSGTNQEPVAQHALGFMISLASHITVYSRVMAKMTVADRLENPGTELFGKTVGIIGLGMIGTRVAQLCNGLFNMKVLAYDPYLSADQVRQRGAQKVEEMDALLRTSDFVTVHCPLTKETKGMFGANQFALMKRSGYFITTARGGIHDEDALVHALKTGIIAGAGVDVFAEEPTPHTHPLLHMDNVSCTPHIAGLTQEAMQRMAEGAAQQWIDLLTGGNAPRVVNPEAHAKFALRYSQMFNDA